ncbi:hypothetical protein [Bacillus sp. 3255]|uniref:hypothetical protein n=1 Tax=Bacillus sp. 3255 TaxID=2817904 RepID=UPI002856639A|nr:hypothetical protein [Bacillus sp. 3255]MDR6884320.1 hypothetical protein [Bacillus sp. 3255]
MILIDDPSIYPIVTTDTMGNLLCVRTYGLHHYGFYDFILEDGFENYEMIFCSLINMVLGLSFDYGKEWFIDGKLFRIETQEDNLAHIRVIDITNIKTLTIYHPITNEPIKYQSLGLRKLYQHPEVYIDANVADATDLLGYVISEVEGGFIYDEEWIITYEMKEFEVFRNIDRYGKDCLEIIERA